MLFMAAETFIQCRVPQATKVALRAAAERQQLTESPAQGCTAMRKSLAFPMQDRPLATQPDYGRVACGTVSLLAYFDRWHNRNFGET
jgi:hypothetical protein